MNGFAPTSTAYSDLQSITFGVDVCYVCRSITQGIGVSLAKIGRN